MSTITVHQGSIFDSTADAIVNPANSFLRHGGGLAKMIADAALGHPIRGFTGTHRDTRRAAFVEKRGGYADAVMKWADDHDAAPLIATGNAHATSAGCLPFEACIHAVGPIWNGGEFCETELLFRAHESAIRKAAELNLKSVAFPAISCGIFGFPVELAADFAMMAAHDEYAVYGRVSIEFWLFEDSHVKAYETALDNLGI